MMHDYESREVVAVGRCNGGCCRTITLSVEPNRIAQMAAHDRRWLDGVKERALKKPCTEAEEKDCRECIGGCANGRPVNLRRTWSDACFVEKHFVLKGASYYDGIYTDERVWFGGYVVNRSFFGILDRPEWMGPARPRQQYRCKAFTGTSCSKYDERPNFCRRFGTPEQPCRVPGCTLSWHPLALDRWADDGGPT